MLAGGMLGGLASGFNRGVNMVRKPQGAPPSPTGVSGPGSSSDDSLGSSLTKSLGGAGDPMMHPVMGGMPAGGQQAMADGGSVSKHYRSGVVDDRHYGKKR
jgi:hypothetical protein